MKRRIILVFVIGIILFYGVQQLDYHVNPWLDPVVTKGELEAARWIKANTSEDALFACDIFGCELVMGAAARRGLIGGDWAGNPDSVTNMQAYHDVALSNSSDEARIILLSNDVDYILVPQRTVFTGFGWHTIEKEKFEDENHFTLVYSNEEVKVYSVVE